MLGHTSCGEVMSWSVRMRIAVGVARGLCFLHSLGEHVVYREDLSTENILLDSDFNAKLSDFGHTHFSGYAKYLNLNHQRMWTIRKRFGSSPEQMLTGQTTQKSDVYGFGMVLLELLSGRKLWGEFAKLIRNSATPFVMIMDPKLLDVYPIEDAKVALTIAYQCVHSRPTTRPTMAHVLSELENLLN
ncbi:unnamed protein product [Cuscuta epithymum]|uniref:Protein kinase domain-containing protein n=2 Tax=Cuscuta epithymum TaxID=186058 RepID=A0AAV0FPS0_9ASTE|nr:unnamed protein product [Cuscuta epithymum]